jgi:hypothetical protein
VRDAEYERTGRFLPVVRDAEYERTRRFLPVVRDPQICSGSALLFLLWLAAPVNMHYSGDQRLQCTQVYSRQYAKLRGSLLAVIN